MSGLSVIIPSKNIANLEPCVRAIREHDPAVNVIVIDDGIAWGGQTGLPPVSLAVIPGAKPFVFARNMNLGIREAKGGIVYCTHPLFEQYRDRSITPGISAGLDAHAQLPDDDVILLNDDALLRTQGGFTALQSIAKEHPDYGVISAVTNVAGNPDQHPRGVGLRDAGVKCVAFVCVLIPRATIDRVGLLDERFTAYGWEDNDYCRRVRNAGLKVGIYDGCYVDHGSLTSTYRGHAHAAGDIWPSAEVYRAKWGDLT